MSSSPSLLILLILALCASPLTESIRSFPDSIYPGYAEAPEYRNGEDCVAAEAYRRPSACDPSLVHIAMTLDMEYLRGSIAAVHSVLKHASCPESVFFHFVFSGDGDRLRSVVRSAFPSLRFELYRFQQEKRVRSLISTSVRAALEQPLNYARTYLADLLPPCVRRVVYLDSDLIIVDDIAKLWESATAGKPVAAPEYCHANFTKYFTSNFWGDKATSRVFAGRSQKPCYFNTGVMVMELEAWRTGRYRERIEEWMEVQKERRIYELGSLPPFLLVFAGEVEAVDHRWNQHGLGGDNVVGSCRGLHPGPVSLLHWSGKGKPWTRLDAGAPCPLDTLWSPYDLYLGGWRAIAERGISAVE
ncbi:unnamed protein product [Victoria cruziana]